MHTAHVDGTAPTSSARPLTLEEFRRDRRAFWLREARKYVRRARAIRARAPRETEAVRFCIETCWLFRSFAREIGRTR